MFFGELDCFPVLNFVDFYHVPSNLGVLLVMAKSLPERIFEQLSCGHIPKCRCTLAPVVNPRVIPGDYIYVTFC